MNLTKLSIINDIEIILSRFRQTDEQRFDEDWLSYKIDDARVEFIIKQYAETGIIDQTWLSDLGVVAFHKVNFADDINVTYCACDIAKANIPQIVSLEKGAGNQDLGLRVMSPCGKTKFYPYPLEMWRDVPEEHTRSLFHYYSRINTALYVNKKVDNLRLIAVLANPEDGYFINSTPIDSGSIAAGTVYLVKYGQVIYNGTVYTANSTFTGVTGITTFTGQGVVYLNSQKAAYDEQKPYPCTKEMARAIVLDILVKEFNIERQQVADIVNDSVDDATKV